MTYLDRLLSGEFGSLAAAEERERRIRERVADHNAAYMRVDPRDILPEEARKRRKEAECLSRLWDEAKEAVQIAGQSSTRR